MATTDRTDATASADAVATRLREATFANLLVRADGESLAAAGLLAGACVATETPYQVSVVRTRDEFRARRDAADEAATSLPIGVADDRDSDDHGASEHPSLTAFEAAEALGADPDPALAFAGVVAGDATPEDAAPAIVGAADAERRSGLASPTADPADALAHTTLAHAEYSGDPDAVEATVESLGDGDDVDRRLASLLAIDAVSADGATTRAAEAVERAIHPLAAGPMETVEGYADVLGALAATAPGLGAALAVADDEGATRDAAIDVWRDHAVAAHEGVRSADVTRYDGLLVARTEGPVEAVARLLRDFRSPEPAVLAMCRGDVADGEDDGTTEAALATTDAPADPIEAAAEAAGGSGLARGTTGYARFDPEREDDLVDAIRGAV